MIQMQRHQRKGEYADGASPLAQLVKIHLQCGRPRFDPWVGKIPWRRERLPTPVFWPGEFHGLYSPRGCRESATAETLTFTSLSHLGPVSCSFSFTVPLRLSFSVPSGRCRGLKAVTSSAYCYGTHFFIHNRQRSTW